MDSVIGLYSNEYLKDELINNDEILNNPYGKHFSKVEYELNAGAVISFEMDKTSSTISISAKGWKHMSRSYFVLILSLCAFALGVEDF
ncbi:hypothetical protein [Paenibacillus sp. FSL K6-2859]|uniref:hypothetical protein n=1 Tax=Paenibacillus sp. FSL K6-2859 TaxID=2921482 RepID=UPI0030FA6519